MGTIPAGNIPEGENSRSLGSGHDEHEEREEVVHGQFVVALQQPRHRALQLLVRSPQDLQLLPGIHRRAAGMEEPRGEKKVGFTEKKKLGFVERVSGDLELRGCLSKGWGKEEATGLGQETFQGGMGHSWCLSDGMGHSWCLQ